jgi:hypothetical protein
MQFPKEVRPPLDVTNPIFEEKKKMAEDEKEEVEVEIIEENGPIYYNPKTLSLVSIVAAWVSWIILVGTILVIIAQVQYVIGIAAQNSTTLIGMLSDAQQGEQARIFVYTNMVLPLFTGLGLFLLLQAASIGLNALLEIEFNMREPKN